MAGLNGAETHPVVGLQVGVEHLDPRKQHPQQVAGNQVAAVIETAKERHDKTIDAADALAVQPIELRCGIELERLAQEGQ